MGYFGFHFPTKTRWTASCPVHIYIYIYIHSPTTPETTMSRNEQIMNKLISTLHERFAINVDQLGHASHLSDIGIDSLHLVDIMLDMEEEFDFRFESLQLPPNPSLDQIARSIVKGSSEAA